MKTFIGLFIFNLCGFLWSTFYTYHPLFPPGHWVFLANGAYWTTLCLYNVCIACFHPGHNYFKAFNK